MTDIVTDENVSNTIAQDTNIENTLSEKKESNDVETLRKQFITRGLTGFVNVGNTCYMNSALQCLMATDILVTYLRGHDGGHGEYKNDLKDALIRLLASEYKKTHEGEDVIVRMKEVKEKFKQTLTYALRNLCVVYWGANCKIKPKLFKSRLSDMKSTFAGASQNDSQECLSFILDQMHEETKTDVVVELKNIPNGVSEYKEIMDYYAKLSSNKHMTDSEKDKIKMELSILKQDHLKEDAFLNGVTYWQKYLKKNHSVIVDIFTGLYFSQITCSNCKYHSFNYEPYNLISLSIPFIQGDLTLEQCFTNNFNVDEHLKDSNQYNCENCSQKSDAVKNTTLWHTPHRLIIQFKRFVNAGQMTYKNKKNIKFPLVGLDLKQYTSHYVDGEHIYDLYGVINHCGDLRFGHYIAYTKNPINDKWYLYDDSNVLHIDDDKIEEKLNGPEAYVLFYKKRNDTLNITTLSDDDFEISDAD